MSRRGLLALLVLLAGLTGCPRRPPSGTDVLETAAEQASGGSTEARTLALAGFHAHLLKDDLAEAQARFDAAIAKDPGDPYALMGQHVLARRAAAADRALAASLELVARNPTHPLAVSAARYILDQVGTSPELDELILKGTRRALEAGATGEAAQLLRGSQLAVGLVRGDPKATAAAVREVGAASVATLLGPFSPYHILAFDEPTPLEKDGSLVGPFTGPYGPLTPRTLVAPDGRHRLDGEPGESDVYLLAFDAEVSEEGVYLARSVSSSSHKVLMDGALLFERRAFARGESTVSGRAVRLTAGKHRFLVKLTKDNATGSISFGLPRADGRPSDVRFTAATGPAPSWGAQEPADVQVPLFFPDSADLAAALTEEAGGLLATYLAVRDGMGRDADGARRLLAEVDEATLTPALLLLRAELATQDRSLPTKVTRGRATRDLEATLAKDPKAVAALLLRAELALSDSQPAAAMEVLKSAQELAGPANFQLHLLKARAALALEVESEAEESLAAALKAQPRLCEAVGLRYSLARRRDAVALMDQLVSDFQGCPGALSRVAEHARQRGDAAAAIKAYEELLVRDPGNVSTGATLANLYVAQRRYEEAAATLKELIRLWPRGAFLYKRLADVREHAGAPAEALALREQALLIDGSDLTLRRAVARAKTGKELLQELAIDGKAAIAAYEAARGEESSAAAYVLDAAAVQAYPDGTLVNRIHTVQKALEQGGIQDIAEVTIPSGAQVLALRTIKADGTVLEPENIEGKEAVSLPGVNVGDYVEVEYLLTEMPRGPIQPGFAASAFYFQVANMPNNWATYTVVAPKGTGLRVDAHGIKVAPPEIKGDVEVFFHEARRVPPFIPEPDGPWYNNEYMPFVVVGAGTTGQERLMAVYADAFFNRSTPTSEIEAFARKVTQGLTGLEAVRTLHAEVMKRVPGRDTGLASSAISTLAQERGSRLMLLKASLESIGIPARLTVVRPFSTDPAPYLFPTEAIMPFSCLRVELPGGEPLWVDTSVRFGPFGQLPENAQGDRDAFLLPEPGRPLEKVKTPPLAEKPSKKVELILELKADGRLQGQGSEVYEGFEGAALAEAFDALSAENRKQSLQNAVARYYGGADLTSVKLTHGEQVGAPLKLTYEFTVPRFARLDGDKRMVSGPVAFPARLGQRYVQLSSRDTPLFLDTTETSDTQVTVTLPEGWKLQDPQADLKVDSRYGRFTRSERQEGRVLTITETMRMPRNRIPPKGYEEFAQFAGDVDLIQTRDLVFTR
jgi:tetratricopeptide (TPR) repeat protein